MNQFVLAPSSHPGLLSRLMGAKSGMILAVPPEDFLSDMFVLFLMVFWPDAIHVPSLLDVAVSRNVSGLSGNIH